MKAKIRDRELARAIVVALANHHTDSFCISTFYDYDSEFVGTVARMIGQPNCDSARLLRAMRRVCRRLEAVGVLYGRVSSCHAEYLGEPRKLKSYQFENPSSRWRINPDSAPHYRNEYPVEFEIDWLVDKAYPQQEKT